MAVGHLEEIDIPAIAGFRLATAACGIKASGNTDLLLVAMDRPCAVAGLFTRNQVRAAPVEICRQRLVRGEARALLVNSGNANVANGPQGREGALATSRAVAQSLAVADESVFLASTGVIGQHFPADKAVAAVADLSARLTPGNWWQAARAIMTTDTFPKAACRQVQVGDATVRVVGLAKGAGMIHPDMATMLAFLFTDAAISPDLLQEILTPAVQESFNSITVDGDTSTNDTVLAFASGAAGRPMDRKNTLELARAMHEVCGVLAQAIVRDGEGATRFITITVTGAPDVAAARQVAYSVAHSPLVKTAFFGGDPNWGRILAAVGYAGVPLELERLTITLGHLLVVRGGVREPTYAEAQAAAIMARPEIPLHIDLGLGSSQATVWTCDLSRDYVTINADYTT